MPKGLLGSLLILLAGSCLALGQTTVAPEPAAAPRPSDSGAAEVKAVPPVEPPAIDTHPWNPPVGHGNIWPYPAPLQVGVPDCGPPGDFWLVPEYLLWGIKSPHRPPLVTIGSPAAAVLGGPDLGNRAFSGGRFTAGTWLDDGHCWGFEGGYFFLGEQSDRFDVSSAGGPGAPVLARPFTDVRTGGPASLLVASPDLGPGTVRISAKSSLQGARADLVYELYCRQPYRVELVGGFRY
jgi:Putative beta barrel porin-7 (BBP7)